MHERARRAHLEGRVELMAGDWAEEVVSASGGDLTTEPRDALRRFFEGYFARVKYIEWRDAAAPVAKVSRDGRMGWLAVKVEARYLLKAEPEKGEQRFKSSWIATYQREGCDWKMTGIASGVAR